MRNRYIAERLNRRYSLRCVGDESSPLTAAVYDAQHTRTEPIAVCECLQDAIKIAHALNNYPAAHDAIADWIRIAADWIRSDAEAQIYAYIHKYGLLL